MTKEKFMSPLEKMASLAHIQEKTGQDMTDPYITSLLSGNSSTSQTASPSSNYYKYGVETPTVSDQLATKDTAQPLKTGGAPDPYYAGGGLPTIKGRKDFRDGAHVAGPGHGTSDDIPAMLADGEFVFPADVVSALGNGSTKAGTEKLYQMMHEIRARARSAKPGDLAPDALKSPLDYLKGRKK